MDFKKLIARTESPAERAILDNICRGCYVETRTDGDGDIQSGYVIDVIRDKYGIPVCVGVADDNELGSVTKDHISVERIHVFEPYDHYVSDPSGYTDPDETAALLESTGFVYDKDDCVWRNKDTGEEICY